MTTGVHATKARGERGCTQDAEEGKSALEWWRRCLSCARAPPLQSPAKLPSYAVQEQELTATLPQESEEQLYGRACSYFLFITMRCLLIILALFAFPLSLLILLLAWRSFWSRVAAPKQVGRPLPLCAFWNRGEGECFNAYCGLVVPARNSSNNSFFRAPHQNITTWHDLPENCQTVWQTDVAIGETGDKCHAWCKGLPYFAFPFFRLDCMDSSGASGGVVHTVCGKAFVAHWFDPIPKDWFPCVQYLGGILYGLIGFFLFLCQLPSPGRSGGYCEVSQHSEDASTLTNDQWKYCACFNGLRWLFLEVRDEHATQTGPSDDGPYDGPSNEEIAENDPFNSSCFRGCRFCKAQGGEVGDENANQSGQSKEEIADYCPYDGPSKEEIRKEGPFDSSLCPGFPFYKAQGGEYYHPCACDLLCESKGLRSYKSDAEGVRKQLKMMIPSMIFEAVLDASGVLSYLMNGQPSYAAAVVTSMSSGKDPFQVVGLSQVAKSLQAGFKSKRLLVWQMLNGLRDTGVGAVIAFYSLVTSPHHALPWHAASLRLMTIVMGFGSAIPAATEAWWLLRMASIGRVNIEKFYDRQACLAKLKYRYLSCESLEGLVKYSDSAALLSMAFMASLSKWSGQRVWIYFFFVCVLFSILGQTMNLKCVDPKNLTVFSFIFRPSVLYVSCSPLFVVRVLIYPGEMQHIRLKWDDINKEFWTSYSITCLAQGLSLIVGFFATVLSLFFLPGVMKTFIKAHRR